MGAPGDGPDGSEGSDRAFVDLHCHTSASFDSLAAPASVVRAASSRGLTHVAVTDHGTLTGALEARERALEARERALEAREDAPVGVTVLVGEEIRTLEGD